MTTDQLTNAAQHIDSITALTASLTGLFSAFMLFIPALIGMASIIAKFTPRPEKGTWRYTYHKWLNVVAMNTGHAENKE